MDKTNSLQVPQLLGNSILHQLHRDYGTAADRTGQGSKGICPLCCHHALCCNVANLTREEYEQRKRRLEEQLRAGVELLEAAYREQMRALDLVWMARSEEGLAISPSPAQEAPPPAARQEAPRSPAPIGPRRPRKELKEEVREALDSLPEVFDRNQVCEVLGYQPDRSSLFRVLQQFLFQGVLAVESYGGGKRTTKYRKTGASVPSGGG